MPNMLKSLILLVALTLFGSFGLVQAQDASLRRALLIGMKDYKDTVGPLNNTHKDVRVMADALAAAGFEVELLLDDVDNGVTISRSKILSRLRAHAQALSDSPEAISFVYYSGHGAANEEDNRNYIIPQNVESIATAELWDESLKLEDAIDRLTLNAPAAAHFVVFDACRNELKLPTESRNLSKGFVAEQAPGGVFLAFSTAEGQVAQDGREGDMAGPFASALAQQIRFGGQNHVTMFLRAAQQVKQSIGQTPYIETGLLQEIYLNGTDGSIVERPGVNATDTTTDETSTRNGSGPMMSQRKALVISNSSYAEPFTPVPTAHETGEKVAEAMQASGFDVVHLQDPSRTIILTEAAEMLTSFEGDAFEKLAVVHYIGHVKGLSDRVNRGLSSGGTNYLIPTNAPIRSSFDLPIHAVELGRILDLASAQAGVSTVFIVDGCRQDSQVSITSTENCVTEEERENVMITINSIEAEATVSDAPTDDDTPPPVQSYSDLFAEELIIGGDISDVVEQTNSKQAVATGKSSTQTSGSLGNDYELAPVTQAELDVAQALNSQTVTQWVAENRPDLIEEKDAKLAAPIRAYQVQTTGTDSLPSSIGQQITTDPVSATTCFDAVQNKIAWDGPGTQNRWNPNNIRTLCAGQETSIEPAKCFDTFMQNGRDRGQSPAWTNARKLCAGTRSASASLACLETQMQRADRPSMAQAITRCVTPD